MLSIILFLLISVTNTQYYRPQRRYPLNNYNRWPPYAPNYSIWNRPSQASVRGNLLNDDTFLLPYGSLILVSLDDVSFQDAPARTINTFVLRGSYRFPIAYVIPYSIRQIQDNSNNIRQYAIQARIEMNGQLLYINDVYTPVQLIPVPVNPVNVVMKKVDTSIYPGNNGGIYPPRPPIINDLYICQLRPEVGPCYASIPQYYYNIQLRSCQTFIWGGCDGNPNRFSTREECERRCSMYWRRTVKHNAKHKCVV